MSDGWIEIVEGGELPEMGEPVLVSGTDGERWYAVARREMVLTNAGSFGSWEWAEDLFGFSLNGSFIDRWREIPR